MNDKWQNERFQTAIYIILYVAIVAFLLFGIYFLLRVDVDVQYGDRGVYNLQDSESVHLLQRDWRSWPCVLLNPAELADYEKEQEPVWLSDEAYKSLRFATHRLELALKPGVEYGITMMTSEYAMHLYIDDELAIEVGRPDKTRETTEHRVGEATHYFTSETGKTHIVVQAANFVHAKGGSWPPKLIVGEANLIERYTTINTAYSFLIIGILLASSLYHLGLFGLNRKRRLFLLFSLCCFLLTVMNKKLFLLIWPHYNWQVGIRLEYTVHYLTFAIVFLFMNKLYDGVLPRTILRVYNAIVFLFIATLAFDSLIFTDIHKYFNYISGLMLLILLMALVRRLRNGDLADYLSFTGVLFLASFGIYDVLYQHGLDIQAPMAGQFFMTPIGMVVFVFIFALVLSIEQAATEQAVRDAKEQASTLVRENVMLEQLNREKSELMDTISHEARTPLAVLGSYAGFVAMELRRMQLDVEMASDIDRIAYEAKRVANLIDRMNQKAFNAQPIASRERLNIGDIVKQTARLFEPMLKRKDVELELSIQKDLTPVMANPEEITQVCFNILQNANQHTWSGEICVSVREAHNNIIICVRDTGDGIQPSILQNIFERGVSGRPGGDGIGLATSRAIVEAHHGSIELDSTYGEGTTVLIGLPIQS